MAQFILWDEKDGAPARDQATGEFSTNGILGRITEENIYLRSYGVRPEGSRAYSDLSVGECVMGVKFSLSGQRGIYSVYRVA